MQTTKPVQDIEELLRNTGYDLKKLEQAKGHALDGEPIAKALLRMNLITLKELCESMSKYYRVPYALIPKQADEYFHVIPINIIRKHQVLPLELKGRVLTLGMLDPRDLHVADDVNFLTGYEISPVGILETQFHDFLKDHAGQGAPLTEAAREVFKSEVTNGDETAPTMTIDPGASGMKKFVKAIVSDAITQRVSDIHIEPQDSALLIRYRVDGFLRTIQVLPRNQHEQLVSALKIMANLDITETRRPQDGRITLKLDTHTIDLRVATILTNFGENLVIRVLDTRTIKLTLEDLGMPDYIQARVKEIASQNTGMFLVTGPTGSGKSTTLYGVIQSVRNPSIKILTLEDPIEYPIIEGEGQEGGITQIQVNAKVGLTFAVGLRAALRLDPDVMLVGEIRDLETAEIASSAALTGRLVLSTLHTNDAPSTISRLIDMQVDPFLIAGSLKAIMGQRLVRRLCKECRVQYHPPAKAMERLARNLPKEVVMSIVPTLYRPQGCKACGGRGYYGRLGLYELLEMNDEINMLILERAPISALRQAAKNSGMRTLRTAGLEEVLRGETTIAEVFRVTPQE